MLIIRLVFALFILVSVILLGCYFLFGEKKYLQYFFKAIKFTVYLLAMLGIGMFIQQSV